MLKKGNKLYSILTGSCPRCHGESMYINSNPYQLGKLFKMRDRCSQCDTKYKIEPSFFFGAMYVSYAVGIAFAVAAFVITYVFIGFTMLNSFIAIVITLVVFLPVIIRISRNIWANFFINFTSEKVGYKSKSV
ncbi:MAG: DUF983 domain-containing protein [Flavobacteriaceae bacterium]